MIVFTGVAKKNFRYQRKYPGHTISHAAIQKCVCPCIEPDKIKDCACPTCTDFSVALDALRGEVGCVACAKTWGTALRSTTSFENCVCCEEQPMPGMERKGRTEPFMMRHLECVTPSALSLGDGGGNLLPCDLCGIDELPETCDCFSASSLDKEVTWLKRQEQVEGKQGAERTVMRLRNYRGTVKELLAQVKDTYKSVLYHRFCYRYTRRQHQLDCDHFDPVTEAIILADFASAMVGSFDSWCLLRYCETTQ